MIRVWGVQGVMLSRWRQNAGPCARLHKKDRVLIFMQPVMMILSLSRSVLLWSRMSGRDENRGLIHVVRVSLNNQCKSIDKDTNLVLFVG